MADTVVVAVVAVVVVVVVKMTNLPYSHSTHLYLKVQMIAMPCHSMKRSLKHQTGFVIQHAQLSEDACP